MLIIALYIHAASCSKYISAIPILITATAILNNVYFIHHLTVFMSSIYKKSINIASTSGFSAPVSFRITFKTLS